MAKTKTKTWKIGEYCKGGIITAEVTGNKIAIIAKEWDSSAGYSRSSNQSNAKEFNRLTVLADEAKAERSLDMFLNDLTSSYYADKVLEWVKSQVELTGREFW